MLADLSDAENREVQRRAMDHACPLDETRSTGSLRWPVRPWAGTADTVAPWQLEGVPVDVIKVHER